MNDIYKFLSVTAILVAAIGQILVTLDDSDEA
jgi:hypothetical protein